MTAPAELETAVAKKISERSCRICKCTERQACNGGCSWVAGEGDLCSVCAVAVEELAVWFSQALTPRIELLVAEAKVRVMRAGR